MKKTANLSKIALLVLSLLLLVTAFASFTGCIGSSSGQATLEATEDELKMEPQLRRIGVQTLPSAQVNKQTGAALFYYAGETNNIKPGDEGYENLTFTVTLTDENNNDISEGSLDWEINENGLIIITASELGTITVKAVSSMTEESAEAEIPVIKQSLTAWDIIILGIGLYALYLGISGRGKIYESEYIKEGMDKKYKLVTRICCILVALCMIASGIVAAVDAYGKLSALNTIMFIVAIVLFLAGMVVTRLLTDTKAKKEDEAKRASGRDMKAPSAAFDFDDDEPTVDDIIKKS